VARAIAASRLPVVSAIGHETDFTIADFVADLRAPTPSAAAELITEAQHKIAEYLADQSHRLERAARYQILQARQRLARVPASRAEGRIVALLHRLEQRRDELALRLEAAVAEQLRQRQRRAAELTAAVLRHDPRQNLAQARERLQACRTRLDRTMERMLHSAASTVSALDARLNSLSPLAVLERGYALVLNAEGGLVRSTAQVTQGNLVTTRLSDGAFTSRVETTAPNESANQSANQSPGPRAPRKQQKK
jgi:exodeoxyribonuclease VII large subunit